MMQSVDQQVAAGRTLKSTAETLKQILNEMDWFCNRLEATADLLPNDIDAQDCLLLAQNVVPLVRNAHAFEEGTVFPALLANPLAPANIKSSVERLRYEHAGDEYFADDLCLSLRQFVTDPKSANIESLTWMLRGFFEGLRRHVAFEREFILPLIAKD
ncbi:MAG: hemerythrin domain-containing protein [Notoacmeibacter sp.]